MSPSKVQEPLPTEPAAVQQPLFKQAAQATAASGAAAASGAGGGSANAKLASAAHTLFAWATLQHHLAGGAAPQPAFEEAVCPLFVSWHKAPRGGSGGEPHLRGCIGTLEGRPLRAGLRDYALTSALRDRRFPAVEARELPRLRCTVSLLSGYEAAAAWDDWEVGTHGLIIEFLDPHTGGRRTATFLPEVAAHEGWDKQQTLDHLIRKAGFAGAPLTVRASSTLKVTRYRSTTCTLTHDEFLQLSSELAAGAGVGAGGASAVQPRHTRKAQQPLVAVGAAQ